MNILQARSALSFPAMILAGLAAAPAGAATGEEDDKFTIEGSVRVRGEAIGGQTRVGLPDKETFLSFQTLIFAEYDAGPIRIGAEFLDARGYGQEEGRTAVTNNDVNPVELLQGYVALDLADAFGPGSESSLTAGRFTMDIGSGRLVDRPSFSNAPPAFTGVNFAWGNEKGDRVFAFWSMPDRHRPDETHTMRKNKVQWDPETTNLQFYGASFATERLGAGVTGEAYVYGLYEDDAEDMASRNRRLATTGLRLSREAKAGRFDFDLEGAYQFGHVRATSAASDRTPLDVSAHFLHAEIGRKFDAGWSPRVSVHFDHTSGDSRDPDSFGRFDTLYGGRRTDFGPTSLYGPVSRPNLISIGTRFEMKPSKRFDMFAMARGLWLEEATDAFGATGVRDRTGGSGTYAGTQVEFRARYWIVPEKYRAEIGGAYLARGAFLKNAPNANDHGDTRYLFIDLVREF